MVRSAKRWSLVAAAFLVATGLLGSGMASAECAKCQAKRAAKVGCGRPGCKKCQASLCRDNRYVDSAARNGLFYNHYADAACGGVPAKLYVSPRPTPPFVGHTYITYEPLMPHENLYRHCRTYYSYDPGRCLPSNTTHVWWW